MAKRKTILWSCITLVLLLYVAWYAKLRAEHVFVRDATYYTTSHGFVPTDSIRLGDLGPRWAWTSQGSRAYYLTLEKVYLPLRWAESLCWRMCRWVRQ